MTVSPTNPTATAIQDVLDKTLWTASASAENKQLLTAALVEAMKGVLGSPTDAELVMAALDTGEWVLERIPEDDVADPDRRWFLKRAVAPFCAVYGPMDKRGMYGPRFWQGATALATLQAAAADLGLKLPGAVRVDAVQRKREARQKRGA